MWAQWELSLLVLVIGGGSILLVCFGLMDISVEVNALVALGVLSVVCLVLGLVTTPLIAKMNVYITIQGALSISIDGASFYFYTNDAVAYPEGPHFSVWFYSSVLGVLGAVCSLIGLWFYNQRMKTWRYQSLFLFANLLWCAIHSLSILIYTRYNLKLGIPDSAFIFGASAAEAVVIMWMWLPGMLLLSRCCPKGVEAVMFAVLAGCHNLGGSCSQFFGAFILRKLGVNPRGAKNESAEFENLWIAALIQILLPLVTLLILPWMIPNATQQEPILKESEEGVEGTATEGSLLQVLCRRWHGDSGSSEALMAGTDGVARGIARDRASYGATGTV